MIKTGIFEEHFIASQKKSNVLMIVLHGKGDSLKPFKHFDSEMALPDVNYLLLNATKRYMDGFSWYGEPPYQREGVLRVRHKMFQLLNELELQGWDLRKVFLLGFSQGCLVCTDTALHYPKKLAGVVGVSGYFNFEPRWRKQIDLMAAKQTPWLLTHGRKDKIIPIEETRFGFNKLKELGLKIDWVESDKSHVFAEEDYVHIKKWVRTHISSLYS